MLEVLPPLRRRQFSIASHSCSHPGHIQLLIAMVDYQTNLKIRRQGLFSSWLKDLPLGSRIGVWVDAPTLFLPTEPGRPVVLVGPGTGVAPMRAFVEDRISRGEGKSACYIFFADDENAPNMTLMFTRATLNSFFEKQTNKQTRYSTLDAGARIKICTMPRRSSRGNPMV